VTSVEGLPQPLSERFKAAMGSVCTPVTVVTALDGDRPHGTTVSAMCSLSLDPPMVMLALDRASALLGVLREQPRFGISVLADRQRPIATNFAAKGDDKFRDVPWVKRWGAPFVVDAACWFACETTDLVPGGDHVVVLAEVLDTGHEDHAPLTYHRRVFGTHTELIVVTEGTA
jgi:flavin reductase (DIM6/NTAB) family NADH-FMN oxidoreductase RutF